MARYKYLLFDADNTLLDFNRAEETAFYAAFSASGFMRTQVPVPGTMRSTTNCGGSWSAER